ncbi:hypothetical protein DRH27_04160, partial [Candidatus Falkowbacteria bacterium]
TYDIIWHASNTNSGLDEELSISIYYSRNSGHTWGVIATSTENDGIFTWRVPLFLEDGAYFVPSPDARIKVTARGPENFMVEALDMSEDFCPPIDFGLITDEEREILRILGMLPDNENSTSGGGAVDAEILTNEPDTIAEDDALAVDEIIDGAGDETGETAGDEPLEKLDPEEITGGEEKFEEKTDEQGEESASNSELLPTEEDQENVEELLDLENLESGEGDQSSIDGENTIHEPDAEGLSPELISEAVESGAEVFDGDEINEQPTVEETDNTISTNMDFSQESSAEILEEN